MLVPNKFLALTALIVTALSGTIAEQTCLNRRGNFKVLGEKFNCLDVRDDRSLCYEHKKFKKKCPALCKANCDCRDSTDKFKSKIKGQLRCKKVARKAIQTCTDPDARMMCPETCNMCYDSFTIAPTPTPHAICVLEAELGFQNLSDINYFGSRSDRLITMKQGESQVCENGSITSWGCLNQGNATVFKSESGVDNYSTSESAQIINGKDGTFHFSVRHVDDDLAADDVNRPMPSALTISVNDDAKASFDHNAYDEKDLKIAVQCDSFCNCIIKKEDSCSLRAELKYPENPEFFGYHRDDVSVTKVGSDEICNMDSVGETSWGCTHTGNAVVWAPKDPDYYDYNNEESVDITSMYGETVSLQVLHQFSEYELLHQSDHQIQGKLHLFINENQVGAFTHPQNRNEDTHLEDGSVNPEFKGEYKVTVSCDENCICETVKQNT